MHDTQFFSYLIDERGLPSFQVASCGFVGGITRGGRDGLSHLTNALDALPSIANFQNLKAILIAADCDSNGPAVFTSIAGMINATAEISPGRRFLPPATELVKGPGDPVIVVMMLPWIGLEGALDTLCYMSAAAQNAAISACVDTFAHCAGADQWPATKQSKMKLRSLISAAHVQDPYLAPAWVWSERTQLVPLAHGAFDQIANFLTGFPTLVI
jgi:hypothetical protein